MKKISVNPELLRPKPKHKKKAQQKQQKTPQTPNKPPTNHLGHKVYSPENSQKNRFPAPEAQFLF